MDCWNGGVQNLLWNTPDQQKQYLARTAMVAASAIAVLPAPVGAQTMTELPFRKCRTDSCWKPSKGNLKVASISLRVKSALRLLISCWAWDSTRSGQSCSTEVWAAVKLLLYLAKVWLLSVLIASIRLDKLIAEYNYHIILCYHVVDKYAETGHITAA